MVMHYCNIDLQYSHYNFAAFATWTRLRLKEEQLCVKAAIYDLNELSPISLKLSQFLKFL